MRLILVAGVLGALVASMSSLTSPAMAAGNRPTVTTVISHDDEVYYIPANPDCDMPVGVTETQQGTERRHIVETDDDFHFVAGETVLVTGVWDDATLGPLPTRRVTDAVVFHRINDGKVVIFHESFRDRGTPYGDIAVQMTYVEVNGIVKVERFSGRNLPPDGC
jgi:hypothetical protein